MQEAQVRNRVRAPHVSAEMLHSMSKLNSGFLELIAARPADWSAAGRIGPAALSAQVLPLSSAQRAAAANCPYALYDLRFHDAAHWHARLQGLGHSSVAEPTAVDLHTLDFVRLALFFAWHVASTAPLAAQLLLGMNEATAMAFRSAAIDCLPSLAVGAADHLTARWSDCAAYWSALTGAATRSNNADLRRIQLYGLQLTAAAHLGG